MPYIRRIGEVSVVNRVGPYELVEWSIRGFPSLSGGRNDYCLSPGFRMGHQRWLLVLFPHFTVEAQDPESEWVRIRLFRCSSGPPQTFRVSVGIRGSEGVEKRRQEEREFSCLDWNDWPDFCRRSELFERGSRLMRGAVLAITCLIRRVHLAGGVLPHTSNHADSEVGQSTNSGQSSDKRGGEKALEDFARLLESGERSDVTVQVGDVEFRAHSAVLCARSPALSVSLRHESAEQASNRIVIEDCEPEVFREFLRFIYTGSVHSLTGQNVFSLYRIADRYLADDLKQQCLEHVQDTLSVHTFCDAVRLAVTHDESGLLERTNAFFAENIRTIVHSDEWQSFILEHPAEANGVLRRSHGPPFERQPSKRLKRN